MRTFPLKASSTRMAILDLGVKPENATNLPIVGLVYLSYVFFVTLSPFDFSFDNSESLPNLYSEKFENLSGLCCVSAWDVLSNLLLFMPFGFLLVLLPGVSRFNVAAKIALSAFSVFLLSFAIESCQLFLTRFPSLVDVVLNTVGGVTGTIVGIFYHVPLTRVMQGCWLSVQGSRFLGLIVSAYALLVFVVFTMPLMRTDFSNWDRRFTFQLGNEATLDRPWLGKIYLVAIYDRALAADEILSNFNAGPLDYATTRRVKGGLVALYMFDEGSGAFVHDRASFESPLNLLIRDSQHVRWLSPSGIEILKPTIIMHPGAAGGLLQGEGRAESDLTVEVWIAPGHLYQTGPARIVSFSQDTSRLNFTLGQSERNLVFRLRTPVTGLNGTRPQLQTTEGPLTSGLQHVAVTYRKAIERLYVNGKGQTELLLDGSTSWDLPCVLYALLGLDAKLVYWPVFLFPLGFLSYVLYSRNGNQTGKALFLSALTGVAFLAAAEGLQMITLRREMDLFLLQVGTWAVLISTMTSAILSKSIQAS